MTREKPCMEMCTIWTTTLTKGRHTTEYKHKKDTCTTTTSAQQTQPKQKTGKYNHADMRTVRTKLHRKNKRSARCTTKDQSTFFLIIVFFLPFPPPPFFAANSLVCWLAYICYARVLISVHCMAAYITLLYLKCLSLPRSFLPQAAPLSRRNRGIDTGCAGYGWVET